MSFFDDIKTSVTAIDSAATVVMFRDTEHDKETFDYTYPVVRISPDISISTALTNGNLIASESYRVEFVDTDDYDNRTNDNYSEQSTESSYEIFERMKVFANSVIYNYYLNYTQAIAVGTTRTFTGNSIIRRGSNFETGLAVNMTININASRNCE